MKTIIQLCAVSLASLSLTAFAADNFKRADANRDRALTKAEACSGKTRHVCRNFEAIDVNRDGVVTRTEVRAFRNARRVAKGLPPKA